MAQDGDYIVTFHRVYPAAPLPIDNRPALSAVTYRTGDYAAFRQAMLQAIPDVDAELARLLGLDEAASPLRRWTSRQSDDYGIALVELWAVLGDILTFYALRRQPGAFRKVDSLDHDGAHPSRLWGSPTRSPSCE